MASPLERVMLRTDNLGRYFRQWHSNIVCGGSERKPRERVRESEMEPELYK